MRDIRQGRPRPEEIQSVVLFAPPNCTGNSGVIGDTILQTSLVRTLLDRSLFPKLERIHWWGAKNVVDELFGYMSPTVVTYEWNGKLETLPNREQVPTEKVDVGLICTREEEVLETLTSSLPEVPLFKTADPLDGHSSMHLAAQLHTSLRSLGLNVENPPEPRIPIMEDEVEKARERMTPNELSDICTHKRLGQRSFDPRFDKVFILTPAVGRSPDERTWSVKTWTHLAHMLSAVGPVVVLHDPRAEDQKLAAAEIVEGERGEAAPMRPRFAVGLIKLREIAAWAYVSRVFIARDSGPLHIAAAMIGPKGRPTVLGLFSIMRPETWRPLSANVTLMGEWPIPLEECVTAQEVAKKATRMEGGRAL